MFNEKLSLLMDGELSDEELDALLDQVGEDAELRDAWGRQHLASAVLQEPAGVVAVNGGFADRVMRALEAEDDQPAAPTERKVVSLGARREARWQRRRWQRPVAGLAIAASVAAVAVLVVQQPQSTQPTVQQTSSAPAVAQTAPTAMPTRSVAYRDARAQSGASDANAVNVTPPQGFDNLFRVVSSDGFNRGFAPSDMGFTAGSYSNPQPARVQVNSMDVSQPAERRALEGFWLNHNSYTSDTGLSSMMGYMHLTAQESVGATQGR